MNKNSAQKLKVFMMGLANRIDSNMDYYIDISLDLKSGTKNFKALILSAGNLLELNYLGEKRTFEVIQLPDEIYNICQSYEKAILTYRERGETLTFEADNKMVNMKNTKTAALASNKAQTENSHYEKVGIGGRNYYIKPTEASNLLKEIGIVDQNGKVKNDMIRKYNQIDHFVELITPMLVKLSERFETINVVDCGCGKSYLSFVLNYYIKEVLKKTCTFTGLDIFGQVISDSKEIAKNLNYKNMDFIETDIKNFQATKPFNLLISLHACDTATDEAIAFGIRNNIDAMIVVPCCHKELLSQYNIETFSKILKHGIFKARIADTLTDGLRGMFMEAYGYSVGAVEYISPLETPKNIMISALKERGFSKKDFDEFKKITELIGTKMSIEKLIY